MPETISVNASRLSLKKGDITDLDIESFVYYARNDLLLGSGFGGAIAMRGGPSIQEELSKIGSIKTSEAVITSAGELKAHYIIHAAGPKFQEKNLKEKLGATVINSLRLADENNIKAIAFPSMGTGLYGIPLDLSAEITVESIIEYLSGKSDIKDVVICLMDSREYKPYQRKFETVRQS